MKGIMRKLLSAVLVLLSASSAFATTQGLRKQSTSTYHLVFAMVLSSDHVSKATGLSPTVTCSKNAGSFNAASGAVTEIANGIYKLAANSTDSNTLGTVLCYATAATADDAWFGFDVVTYDPFTYPDTGATIAGVTTTTTATTCTTATNLTNAPTNGDFTAAMKTSLNNSTPASVTGAVGSVTGAVGSVTGAVGSVMGAVGSVTGNVGGNVTGSVASVTARVTANTDQWAGTTIPAPSVTGVPKVDVVDFRGTTSAGAAGYAGIDWSAINAPTTTVGLTNTTISASSNPTLTQIVNGVWDEAQSSHTNAGTFGLYLDTTVSSRSTLTSATVTVSGPVLTDSSISVVRGDDYNSSDTGRAISWTITGYPTFVAGTVTFTATRGSTTITKTGYVSSATVIGVNLTAADTLALTVGTASYKVAVSVLLSNGRVVTPVITTMSVL